MNGFPSIFCSQKTSPNPASVRPLSLITSTATGLKLSLVFTFGTVQSVQPFAPRYFVSFVSNVNILFCSSFSNIELSSCRFVCSGFMRFSPSSNGARPQDENRASAAKTINRFSCFIAFSLLIFDYLVQRNCIFYDCAETVSRGQRRPFRKNLKIKVFCFISGVLNLVSCLMPYALAFKS